MATLLQCFPYGRRGERVGFPRARFIGPILMSLGVADWFDTADIVLRAWGEVFCKSMRPNETLFRPFAKTLPFCSRAGGLGVVRGDQHGARQPGLIRPIWLSAVARRVLFLSQQKLARRKRDLTAGGIFDVHYKSKAYACSGWMFDSFICVLHLRMVM